MRDQATCPAALLPNSHFLFALPPLPISDAEGLRPEDDVMLEARVDLEAVGRFVAAEADALTMA